MPEPTDLPVDAPAPRPRAGGHAAAIAAATATLAALSYLAYVVADEFVRDDTEIAEATFDFATSPPAAASPRCDARTIAPNPPADGAAGH